MDRIVAAARAAGAAFALVLLGFFYAHAVVGVQPTPNGDFGLISQQWAYNLAAGNNWIYTSGVTAHAGGGQTSATPLPPNAFLIEVDTVATTGDSVVLPYCLKGDASLLRNAGGASMNVFANPGTNPNTGTLGGDSINGSANTASYAVGSNNSAVVFCAKDGVWSVFHGN